MGRVDLVGHKAQLKEMVGRSSPPPTSFVVVAVGVSLLHPLP